MKWGEGVILTNLKTLSTLLNVRIECSAGENVAVYTDTHQSYIPSWILLWWQFEWSFGKFCKYVHCERQIASHKHKTLSDTGMRAKEVWNWVCLDVFWKFSYSKNILTAHCNLYFRCYVFLTSSFSSSYLCFHSTRLQSQIHTHCLVENMWTCVLSQWLSEDIRSVCLVWCVCF